MLSMLTAKSSPTNAESTRGPGGRSPTSRTADERSAPFLREWLRLQFLEIANGVKAGTPMDSARIDELNLTLQLVMMVELLGQPTLDRIGAQELMKVIATYRTAGKKAGMKQAEGALSERDADEFSKKLAAAVAEAK